MKNLIFLLVIGLFSIGARAGIIESFLPTDFDGVNDDSGALIAFEYGEWWSTSGISFGFYLTDTGDNSVESKMEIFGGGDSWLSGSTVAWDFANQKATASNGNMLDWNGIELDWRLGAYFEYDLWSDATGVKTIYSHDALNGGSDLVDITEIDWAGFDLSFTFSDDAFGSVGNWDNIGQLVKVSDVTPFETGPGVLCVDCGTTDIPEPHAVALFAMGLLGLGAVSRRKKASIS